MSADDDREETAFDFKVHGGVRHLVETVLTEIGDDEESTASALIFPKQVKEVEPRDAPTQFVDAQQASVDRAVAASLITGEQRPVPSEIPIPRALSLPPLPSIPPPFPPPALTPPHAHLSSDLEIAPRIVVGKPEPENALALDIEAIAARPSRPSAPVWIPDKVEETAPLPKAFWIAALVLVLIVAGYTILR